MDMYMDMTLDMYMDSPLKTELCDFIFDLVACRLHCAFSPAAARLCFLHVLTLLSPILAESICIYGYIYIYVGCEYGYGYGYGYEYGF